MNEAHCTKIAGELSIRPAQVRAVADLLAGGATIPFISRYRKEATGSLDEMAVTTVRDRLARLEELDQRRAAILKSLEERELLTDELREKVEAAETLSVLEDIYLPFRPKRRTRATIARERGLEPLAERLFAQEDLDPVAAADPFVDEEKGVATVEEALAGARDIMAEWVSEDAGARAELRDLFTQKGMLRSRVVKGKEEEGSKFRDYFAWEEPVAKAPSHRVLAIRRGEGEQMLFVRIQPPEGEALARLENRFVTKRNGAGEQVRLAVHDSYRRLLGPAMETEARLCSKERADVEAIQVFATNLRQLLLAAPLGQKAVIALDPGFRTGCKLVCLDSQGKLLQDDVIYPHTGAGQAEEATRKMREICRRFPCSAIAVGNGTAGRETVAFLEKLELEGSPPVVMVNESGASVYSASAVAREELPDRDVTVRGAVSIGRRLQDPLAELVKIDPKSIGVGQYQHDVNQAALRATLDDVVSSCVNAVGVEVNTASRQLLTYVSGLGAQLARNIVEHRDREGPFRTRKALKQVARLGPKAFEQSAGFLRIRDGADPLDASAVHPESYPVVEAMARDLGCKVGNLLEDPDLRGRIDPGRYVSDRVGLPTLRDILAELDKPGRDPREAFEPFQFAEGVNGIDDLRKGMRLPGKVTNLTKFGAFVDVGVHQDGLVHVSEMADRFVKDPAEIVKLGQTVTVTVLDVDTERRRISLSLRDAPDRKKGRPQPSSRSGKPAPSRAGKPPPDRRKRGRADKSGQDGPDPNNPFVQAFRKANWKPES